MNILSDFHHSDLFYSLQLLFEKRLGHNLFRPIGLEWYEKGYWAVYDHPDTAQQYLGLKQGYQPADGTLPLNEGQEIASWLYFCEDLHNNTINKALTFEGFENMKIDIVIASIPAHIKPFKELAKMKNAKFIFQMGNMFTEVIDHLDEIPNLLASTISFPTPHNSVFYHQEFDTDIFKPQPVLPINQITSFINILQNTGHYQKYLDLKAGLPEYTFKSYGGQCEDGSIGTSKEIADIMGQSRFGFHAKWMGDGFGHVLYNWYACGKPVITSISDYKGKLGEELLEDMVSCIDLDQHSIENACAIIRAMSDEKYQDMREQARMKFTTHVDYDTEQERIEAFLERLQ